MCCRVGLGYACNPVQRRLLIVAQEANAFTRNHAPNDPCVMPDQRVPQMRSRHCICTMLLPRIICIHACRSEDYGLKDDWSTVWESTAGGVSKKRRTSQ